VDVDKRVLFVLVLHIRPMLAARRRAWLCSHESRILVADLPVQLHDALYIRIHLTDQRKVLGESLRLLRVVVRLDLKQKVSAECVGCIC